MASIHLAFYMKTGTIHIYKNTMRAIGEPRRVSLLLDESGNNLIVAPHKERDLKSHRVPENFYTEKKDMEIHSKKLCKIMADLHGWEFPLSYRIPGKVYSSQKIAVFDISSAICINRQLNDL